MYIVLSIVLAIALVSSPASARLGDARRLEAGAAIDGQFVVVLDPSVSDVSTLASTLLGGTGELLFTYKNALKGFSASGLSEERVGLISASDLVLSIEQVSFKSRADSKCKDSDLTRLRFVTPTGHCRHDRRHSERPRLGS